MESLLPIDESSVGRGLLQGCLDALGTRSQPGTQDTLPAVPATFSGQGKPLVEAGIDV